MDNTGREYRYQKDWSIGTTMFHVRCDDWESFKESVANMESILTQTKSFPDDSGSMATPPEKAQDVPSCGVHHTAMTWKAPGVSKNTGKPYPGFWSCGMKNENGTWCTFRPK